MSDPLEIPSAKPPFRFPAPEFIDPAQQRGAIARKSVEQQIAMLSKVSLSARVVGTGINTQYPRAKRIATYQTGVPIGILSAVLSTSIANPVDGVAGVVVAIGREDTINIAESGIVLLQHFCEWVASAQPVATVSGMASDGKSVEYLSSGMNVSLYAFGANDATVLITGGVTFKFAVIG